MNSHVRARLLDRALRCRTARCKRTPHARQPRIARGDFAAARADCLAVMQAGRPPRHRSASRRHSHGPGSLDRARACFHRSITRNSRSAAISHWRLMTQADLALRAGDDVAAVQYLERAHALDAAHEETRVRLAAALFARGDAARATALVKGANMSAALLVARIRAASRVDVTAAAAARREFEELLAIGQRRGTESHSARSRRARPACRR